MRTSTTRRLASLAAGAMVMPLVLTACSSSDSSGGGGNKAAAQCGSGAGVGKPSGGTIKVGFQGPLSGDNQQLGINARDGMKVAIDAANKSNALPYKIQLVESDDMGSPDQGPTAAQKLIDDQGVVAVVGPMFSGATKASEPAFCQSGVLSISPSATNPTLTSLGFTNFVRVIAPDTVQGKSAADYMTKSLKAKKVFSLDDKSEYGTGLSSALEAQLQANGAQVVHDGINPTKDYTSEATKIVGENPDALYYSGYYAEMALLVKALKAKGYKGKILSRRRVERRPVHRSRPVRRTPTAPTSPAPAATPTPTRRRRASSVTTPPSTATPSRVPTRVRRTTPRTR